MPDGVFGVKNKNINDIANYNNKKGNKRNVKIIKKIKDEFAQKKHYKFESFGDYWNLIHNKSLYKGMDNNNQHPNSSIDSKILTGKNYLNTPSNFILYGPPGTGKTYHTINKALEIIYAVNSDQLLEKCRNDSNIDVSKIVNDREVLKIAFNYYKSINVGQIQFVTFHQSYGYEEFVEGIKPETNDNDDVIYIKKSGVFKKMCERIIENSVEDENNFNNLYSSFIRHLKTKISSLDKNEIYSFKSKQSEVHLIEIDNNNDIMTIGQDAGEKVSMKKKRIEIIYKKYPSSNDLKSPRELRKLGPGFEWHTNYYAVYADLKRFEIDNYNKESILFDGFYCGSNTLSIKKNWTLLMEAYNNVNKFDYTNINNNRFVSFKFTKNLTSNELLVNIIENSHNDKQLYIKYKTTRRETVWFNGNVPFNGRSVYAPRNNGDGIRLQVKNINEFFINCPIGDNIIIYITIKIPNTNSNSKFKYLTLINV